MSEIKKLVPSDLVPLHNHTHYSLLDGLTKIKPMVGYVKEMGMEAVAITDHGTLSGAIEFYKEAKSQKIKPTGQRQAVLPPYSACNE
jgi:DNA polymerase III alpha subunit